jgi:DNA adenine methylase Dam
MLTPFPYQGSKIKELGKLREFFKPNCKVVEPFVGSGIVFGEFASRAAVNDVMFEIAGIWRLAKERDVDFIDFAQKTLTEENRSQELFYALREEYNELWRAEIYNHRRICLFFYLLFSCHAAMIRFGPNGFNTPFKLFLLNGRTYTIDARLETLFRYADKIDMVYQFDANDFIRQNWEDYDVIYADPPYIESTGYDGSWTYEKLKELDQLLHWKSKKGMTCIMSNYPNGDLLDWTRADRVVRHKTTRMVGTKTIQKDDVILLYGNVHQMYELDI